MEQREKQIQNRKQVILYESKSQLVTAAVDKIVVEIFNKKEKSDMAQLILLTGCSPLAGTTSTCIGLGIAIANTQRRTLLIDCDMRKTVKYKKLNDQVTVGLSDCLSQDGMNPSFDYADVLYETNIKNLSFIPCGANTDNATRLLCSTNMGKLLENVRKEYDCIIFDLPSLTIVPDAQILFQNVDGIILLSALGETRKNQIREAKLKIAPYMEKYYGMIVNKVQPDMYRWNVRDYDYYFLDGKGEQKLSGSPARKKYKKHVQAEGGK